MKHNADSSPEPHLQFLLDHSAEAVVVIDADDAIHGWNERAERLLGWKRAEQMGQKLACFQLDGGSSAYQFMQQQLEASTGGYKECSFMLQARPRGGEPIAVAVSPVALTLGSKANQTLICFYLRRASSAEAELQELKKTIAQERLQSTATAARSDSASTQSHDDLHYRAHLAALVESSYDAIIGRDVDGRITSWNTGAQRIYGYTESEALGQSITLTLPIHLAQEEPEVRRAVQTGARLEQFETIRRRKDGRLVSISLTISPITNDEGRIVGSSSIERDFTDRKRNEEELRLAKEAAEEASRARVEFLANVSHELRTPMNAIIGMTQLALGEELSEEVRDFISTANESAHSLLNLLNDILDFSKLEAGKFTIDNAPFDLRATLDETVKSLSMRAFEKKLELACEMGSHVPTGLIGDGARLRQVLTNLIGNAIKFTEQGEVVVRVEAVRTWRTEAVLLFSVADTGVGIRVEDQGRILEPFTQVDASTTRRHGGTGLGLAICNELLKLMGSRLTIHSNPGQGSRFSFRVTFGLQQEDQRAPRVPSPLISLRSMPVLVVDDNESNLRIISKSLSTWSLVPQTAGSGTEALRKLAEAEQAQRPFSLVIVDALMPEMDGFELAEQLPQKLSQPPAVVLMVNSSNRRELKQRSAQVGASVCLHKPVSQSDLMDAIMRALNIDYVESELPAELAAAEETKTPLSVLLAEDTPANQKVVTGMLRKRGHRVTIAGDGREAVELFEKQRFDVVLMDVQMPKMDGLEATAAIRQKKRHRGDSVAIIAMTAHAMLGDRERCLQAGMDAYLAKPIDVGELLDLVESVGQAPQPIESASTETDETVKPLKASPRLSLAVDTPVIDLTATMERLGGDEELLQSFIGFFEEDYPQLLKSVVQSAAAHDFETLQRAAHSLKGLAANFSAAACTAVAGKVELQARDHNLTGIDENLAQLQEELKRVEAALKKHRR